MQPPIHRLLTTRSLVDHALSVTALGADPTADAAPRQEHSSTSVPFLGGADRKYIPKRVHRREARALSAPVLRALKSTLTANTAGGMDNPVTSAYLSRSRLARTREQVHAPAPVGADAEE